MISKILDENTLIPISFVLTICALSVWLTTLYNTSYAHSEAIQSIQSDQKEYTKNLHEIKDRLLSIEYELKQIRRK